jgi:4-amino-4-deoxy-L-arabinose transferase-like glycosyltransferase
VAALARGRLARPARALLAIVLCAIAVRVVYFVQIQRTVFVELHRLDETDMHYYDGWARRIAAGDWWSRGVGVPMHSWHQAVARAYLEQRPTVPAATGGPSPGALWARWLDTPRFYQDPLHPYLIALTYSIAGADVRWVFIWQLALGVLTTVLVWALARRYFGEPAGVAAGILAVLSAPLVYYEMILLKESTIAFAGLLLVWMLDRAIASGRTLAWVGLGVALGLSVLLKATFGLFGAAVFVALSWMYRTERARLVHAGGAVALGIALGLAPLVARNLIVGVPPLAGGSTGPLTFAASNQVSYRADSGFSFDPAELADVVGRHDGRGTDVVLETLRRHSWSSALGLAWRKFEQAWHWYEVPNNENYYYLRHWIPVLAWLPVTFWVVAPLAWLGTFVALRRARTTWPLLLLVACSLAPLVVFYVLGRFRVGLLAALLPLAGAGCVQLWTWTRARAYGPLALASAGLVAVALWTGRPLASDRSLIRTGDWMLPLAIQYEPEVRRALDADDANRAADGLLRFLDYAPSEAVFLSDRSGELAARFGGLHAECAKLLKRAGRTQEALRLEQRAAALMRRR